jgi:hypothetical protein
MAQSVIDELLDLEERLSEEIRTHPSDIIRTPLKNVKGDLSHLKSALKQVKSLERPDE